MNRHLPILGITMGDPVGIGPEILLEALNDPRVFKCCRPVIIGDPEAFNKAACIRNRKTSFNLITNVGNCRFDKNNVDLLVISDLHQSELNYGEPTIRTGKAMTDCIIMAADLALEGKIHGMVTCPVNKLSMKKAGSEFHGHTELIAASSGKKRFVMMMSGRTLSVVLVTIHISLDQVPDAITAEKILDTIVITGNDMIRRFGVKAPRIAVAGLNPHAGEDGLFGNEEKTKILPAIEQARMKGFNVSGPHPPDTVYVHAAEGLYDVVVSMYHDQGLIPFKLIHFKDGVNTTLGLPLIRTSVDHGTAYDIAGKGLADPSSLVEAISLAALQAENEKGIYIK